LGHLCPIKENVISLNDGKYSCRVLGEQRVTGAAHNGGKKLGVVPVACESQAHYDWRTPHQNVG